MLKRRAGRGSKATLFMAAAVFACLLITPSYAAAQSACSQYNPSCPGDTGPTGGDQPDAGNLGAGGGGGDQDGDGAVTGGIPFSGYPLTPLAWIALALVGGALMVRLGRSGYDRWSASRRTS